MSYRQTHKAQSTFFQVICCLLIMVLLFETLSPLYLDSHQIDTIELTENTEKEAKEEKKDEKEETDEYLHHTLSARLWYQENEESIKRPNFLLAKPWIEIFIPPPENQIPLP